LRHGRGWNDQPKDKSTRKVSHSSFEVSLAVGDQVLFEDSPSHDPMGEGTTAGGQDVYSYYSREGATPAHIRAMNDSELAGILEFLRQAEQMKTVKRSAFTTTGEVESVAEHSWRVALMAMLVSPQFADVDANRLVRMCLVHDLGEAIGGDIPAPEQARRRTNGAVEGKSAAERRDLLTLVETLPPAQRDEIIDLWDEYEAAETPVAKLAKAVDKLETILQHTQGINPPGFDYRFNLVYGREHTEHPPLIAAIRAILDRETEDRSRGTE
jgi:putative hydrolase of HD superfamily